MERIEARITEGKKGRYPFGRIGPQQQLLIPLAERTKRNGSQYTYVELQKLITIALWQMRKRYPVRFAGKVFATKADHDAKGVWIMRTDHGNENE